MPSSTSRIATGVTSSASMVPRSHSRAITIAVSRAPMRVMMTAISPGTRKLRLRSSLLNHTRCSSRIGLPVAMFRTFPSRSSQFAHTPCR